MNRESLIYDWNAEDIALYNTKVELDDETLRDGLQSASVRQPNVAQKIEILHLMNDLGIHLADIGLPGAGEAVAKDVLAIAKEIADNKMSIRAGCAARTVIADIQPIIDISQKTGMPIEVHAFIGSSPIRRYTEGWDLDTMLKHTREAADFSVSNGCPIMFVTEDTVRTDPETLKILLNEAIEHGASRLCLCDTVGHSTPGGVRRLIAFVREEVVKPSGEDIKIDWHGHSDRGLALSNSLAAIKAGADRVHGTCLGIGERAGNTAMDLLLVNLQLLGIAKQDLRKLKEYCVTVSRYCGYSIPSNYPVVGQDAFRTGTGVHAAAIIKSLAKEEDHWLSDLVYSSVAAEDFGFQQIIDVGPMSGKSNIEYWLKKKGINQDDHVVDAIFQHAKSSDHILDDDEIYRVIVERCIACSDTPEGVEA